MARTLDDRDYLAFEQDSSGVNKFNRRVVIVGDLLDGVAYDCIAVAYPTTSTETYTYKTGGLGGTTVRVITVTYTDSTKADLSSVVRTS